MTGKNVVNVVVTDGQPGQFVVPMPEMQAGTLVRQAIETVLGWTNAAPEALLVLVPGCGYYRLDERMQVVRTTLAEVGR